MNNSSTSWVAWLGLIIAIIALIIGWVAYNRTGEDLTERVQEEVAESLAEIQVSLDNLETEIRGETAETLRDAAQDAETDEQ